MRISDANKRELQESGWLRDLLPNVRARRAFMKWLERNHKTGEAHIHLSPGSNEAVVALGEFLRPGAAMAAGGSDESSDSTLTGSG